MPRSQAAREAIEAFFADCGVSAQLSDRPIDRFAEADQRPSRGLPVPAVNEPHLPAGEPEELRPSNAAHSATAAPAPAEARFRNDEPPRDASRHPAPAEADAAGLIEDARQAARCAADLDALHAAREAFEGCALKATANRTVRGEGPAGAPLMLIGEAPGQEEDREGRPFVGRSGKLLDKMLAAIGWPRERVYITNVIPWRPPFNRTPTPQETAACAVFVQREIALVGPKILVPMGGSAAKTLLKTEAGIMSQRGRWTHYEADEIVLDAMAMYHPAFLLRSPIQKKVAWQDLLAVAQRLERHGIPPAH